MMDTTTSVNTVNSPLTTGHARRHRIGRGAFQKRIDKFRTHLNEKFEQDRQAALSRFMIHFDSSRFNREMQDIVAGKGKQYRTDDVTVEVDEEAVHQAQDTNDDTFVIDYDDNEDIVFPSSDKNWSDESTFVCVDQPDPQEVILPEVSSVDTSICEDVSEVVPLEDAPKSPEYMPDSPKHSELPLVIRKYKECIKFRLPLVQKTVVKRRSPIFLHSLKYTAVIYSQTIDTRFVNLEDFLERMPLARRISVPLERQLPYHSMTFQTTSVTNAIELHKKEVCVIAHIKPRGYRLAVNDDSSIQSLLHAGVMTFVSLNSIKSDIKICDSTQCLYKHRKFFGRARQADKRIG